MLACLPPTNLADQALHRITRTTTANTLLLFFDYCNASIEDLTIPRGKRTGHKLKISRSQQGGGYPAISVSTVTTHSLTGIHHINSPTTTPWLFPDVCSSGGQQQHTHCCTNWAFEHAQRHSDDHFLAFTVVFLSARRTHATDIEAPGGCNPASSTALGRRAFDQGFHRTDEHRRRVPATTGFLQQLDRSWLCCPAPQRARRRRRFKIAGSARSASGRQRRGRYSSKVPRLLAPSS